ncbi:DUF2625 family protein [Streptomyces profundus]|uniref:DUF2625 family protein n=1 Tax=Streptomyces profundus TaxID=2867410 RepID=UPI001D1610D9|nr:DUF2625 family protein [Streptomyces sp. MA3_2.13]UED85460.1 DUF2625 domain-containing protein [Streptomyces sp. MA3_2.13]
MEARGLEELTEVSEPAWPELVSKVSSAPLPVEIVPADPALGRATLLQLQVTARSYLGAFALHCGGLLVDDGWLRVFGSATPRNPGGMPGLAEVNAFPEHFAPDWRPSPGLVVAQDVLGGTFAVNGDHESDPAATGRPGGPGEVIYFAPDTLRWQALELPYAGWLDWVLSGGTTDFYQRLRWPGWRADTGALETATDGVSLVPPLWSLEAQRDLASTARRPVPMAELLGLHHRYARQLTNADPGFIGRTEGLD